MEPMQLGSPKREPWRLDPLPRNGTLQAHAHRRSFCPGQSVTRRFELLARQGGIGCGDRRSSEIGCREAVKA